MYFWGGEMILRYFLSGISGVLLVFATPAQALEAPELNVRHTIIINAPSEKVWDIVSDFGGLHQWLIFI